MSFGTILSQLPQTLITDAFDAWWQRVRVRSSVLSFYHDRLAVPAGLDAPQPQRPSR